MTILSVQARKARELKIQALELLEWAVEDMSPAGGPELHIKAGFEREGHFIKPVHEQPAPSFDWHIKNEIEMEEHAKRLAQLVGKDTRLRNIYYDNAGTYKLEVVTHPLGLVRATRAIDEICDTAMHRARKDGFSQANFGPVPATIVDEFESKAGGLFKSGEFAPSQFQDYYGEVFNVPGQGKTLFGCGQHCNLSLWKGNENLFVRDRNDPAAANNQLVNHIAEKSLKWLPYTFLLCRKGNYYRIAANSDFGVHHFSAKDAVSENEPKSFKTGHILRYTADHSARLIMHVWNPKTFRLEFRQAVAEADPYDVALASVTPMVKTCDEIFQKDLNGKIVLDKHKHPILTHPSDFPSELQYNERVPHNEEEAKVAFDPENNPYFSYLDELAERRIQKAVAENYGGFTETLALGEVYSLRGIGSRLLASYCSEYNIPVPEKTERIISARPRW